MDKARKQTEHQLLEMEGHLRQIYQQAQSEITEKWDDYMERGRARLDDLYAAYRSAPADQKAAALKRYQDAMRNYTLRNKWYRDMVNETTYRLAHVNEIAIAYVNNEIPSIYVTNFNQIDPDALLVRSQWTLVNEHTVRNLIRDSLPEKTLNYAKDMAWNSRQINSAILQGIIQGESITKMSKRLLPIVGNNEKAAIRTARTMVTGAENRGRLDRYKDYESQGVVLTKVWLATADGRTRDWHLDMDGQEVPVDDYFIDGLGNELDAPGDPGAPGETVYNCFVADTSVATNCDIIRSYKHEFSGDLFTIKTAGGVEFTCTPNHPILTLRGWIPANALHESDHILVTFRLDSGIFGFNPHIKHIFSRFDALHEFGEEGSAERATNLNVNFHGDIPTSDVEIVTQERLLRNDRNSGLCKCINKFLFKSTDMPFSCKRSFVEHLWSIGLSPFCAIGRRCKSLAFLWRSLAHAKIHGLRPIAWGNSGCFEPIDDGRSGHIEILRKCLDGFSGMVCSDKIINIDIKFSHCDVFNLQSENGYYFVNSSISKKRKKNNDIMAIVQNCRCSMRSHILGVRGANGRMTPISNYRNDKGLHVPQIAAERARRGA